MQLVKLEPLNSPRFQLNENDLHKWLYNAVVFLAPAALAFLLVIQNGGTAEEGLVALKLWGLNTTVDLLKKFIAQN